MTSTKQTLPGVQSIERAVAILRVLAHSSLETDAAYLGYALSSIAKEVSLSPSTTHRIIRTLVDAHLVTQDAVTERYHLGPFAGVLGKKYLSSIGLESVQPLLQRLCTLSGESTSLAVLHDGVAHVVAQEHSPQALRVDHLSGSELSLHASAMGKVLLAYSSLNIAESIRQLGKLEKFTSSTITSKQRLATHIQQVALHGYATNEGERYAGANGIAVPVLPYDSTSQKTQYALGIQGPNTRLTPERMLALVRICQDTAAQITALGISVA